MAPGLLTLVDYLLGTLHIWIREGANNLTLRRWSEHCHMRDGQHYVGVRLPAVDGVLYWRYRREDFAFAMAPPIGRDKWRCPEPLGMTVLVFFHREPPPPPRRAAQGAPRVPPMTWREAQHRVLLLEGWDPRGDGHGCAVDAMGRIYDPVKDRPTAVEEGWDEVVCRVQACLPYVTAECFVALPPVSAQLATRGNP